MAGNSIKPGRAAQTEPNKEDTPTTSAPVSAAASLPCFTTGVNNHSLSLTCCSLTSSPTVLTLSLAMTSTPNLPPSCRSFDTGRGASRPATAAAAIQQGTASMTHDAAAGHGACQQHQQLSTAAMCLLTPKQAGKRRPQLRQLPCHVAPRAHNIGGRQHAQASNSPGTTVCCAGLCSPDPSLARIFE